MQVGKEIQPSSDAPSLRQMTASDFGDVARLQSGLLQNSAVTQLGIRFLIRFYRAALASERCEAFVACDAEGQVIGAALATVDVAQFNAYVTPRITLPLLVSLSRRWGLAVRFLRGCFEERTSPRVAAELLLLFVDGRRQAPCDMGQRHVDDGRIQHFHESAEHHRNGDDPRIDVGMFCSFFAGHSLIL